jgi:hypothetical protein
MIILQYCIENRRSFTIISFFCSDRKYDEWQVFVGKHHTNVKDKNEQSYTISKFIPHERFDRNTLMNDIALIVLKVNFSLYFFIFSFVTYFISQCYSSPLVLQMASGCLQYCISYF